MKKYLKLLRINHYLKNFLIFLPILFSKNMFSPDKLFPCICGFISFCLMASAIYIINDIKDIEKDRNHPIKKKRPLANKSISIKNAVTILVALVAISLSILIFTIFKFNLGYFPLIYLILYLLINIIYSFGIKNIPILDILILSSGFLIRVLYGGAITSVTISNWLFLTVLCMSLYLVLGKRRNELIKNFDSSRKVLGCYNKNFLDKNMYMFLSMTLIFYCLWILESFINTSLLLYSILIVVFIIMKYNLKIEEDSYGDPIDVVFEDKILFCSIVIYVIYIACVIYIC